MKAKDRIGDYVLEDNLGNGETGSTWIARKAALPATAGSGDVVLKIFDLGAARGWSGYELFLREIEALKTFEHPGIPRFLDYFEDGGDGGRRFVLAMERMRGRNLESLATGRRFSEREVSAILAGLADILAYLSSLRPPVVHRDVNPRNVLLDSEGAVALVDFSGAQKAALRGARPGATLIGTAGYIPLEQVSGRASVRSDRYGAAATALVLLPRANPAELPQRVLNPDLAALPSLGRGLGAVLSSWIEPDEVKRDLEPGLAARILRGRASIPASRAGEAATSAPKGGTAAAGLPSNSRVRIEERENGLRISIPPLGLGAAGTLGAGGFTVLWLGFVAFWTFGAAAMGAPLFFVLFSLPFWAVGIILGGTILRAALLRTELTLDAKAGLTVSRRLFGLGRVSACPPGDLGDCVIVNSSVRIGGRIQRQLAIEAGAATLRIGTGLTERELNAIRAGIEAWRGASRRDGGTTRK
ncbi:MAG: protein kinase [Spirochaetaceae bacterium]|nr:protein kinase [Spirochaetaceae bacterium]